VNLLTKQLVCHLIPRLQLLTHTLQNVIWQEPVEQVGLDFVGKTEIFLSTNQILQLPAFGIHHGERSQQQQPPQEE
jgi:hypothetical protein